MGAGSHRSPARARAPASRRVAPAPSGTPLSVWVQRAAALGGALALLAGMKLGWEGTAANRCFLFAGLCALVWAAAALVALFSPYHPEIDGLRDARRRDSADGGDDPFDDGDGGDGGD